MLRKSEDRARNKVILIGSNHRNTLGLVRNFGQNGIRPYGILLKNTKNFSEKSKYWAGITVVDSLDEIVPTLMEKFGSESLKPVVLPVFDEDADVIDKNYDLLKEKFLLPTLQGQQGKIIELMNKSLQNRFIESIGFRTLPDIVLDLDQPLSDIPFGLPRILKPVVSNEGQKADIAICWTEDDFSRSLGEFRENGYHRALCEFFLADKTEYMVVGAVSEHGWSYTLVRKFRRWTPEFGTTSFGKAVVGSVTDRYVSGLMDAVHDYGYRGLIDVEFFEDREGNFFINEFNWRSSGSNCISLGSKVYSAYLYYLDAIGQMQDYKVINQKEFYMMYETHDIGNARSVGFARWIRDFFRTRVYNLWSWRDPRPALIEYGWNIRHKLKHGNESKGNKI